MSFVCLHRGGQNTFMTGCPAPYGTLISFWLVAIKSNLLLGCAFLCLFCVLFTFVGIVGRPLSRVEFVKENY